MFMITSLYRHDHRTMHMSQIQNDPVSNDSLLDNIIQPIADNTYALSSYVLKVVLSIKVDPYFTICTLFMIFVAMPIHNYFTVPQAKEFFNQNMIDLLDLILISLSEHRMIFNSELLKQQLVDKNITIKDLWQFDEDEIINIESNLTIPRIQSLFSLRQLSLEEISMLDEHSLYAFQNDNLTTLFEYELISFKQISQLSNKSSDLFDNSTILRKFICDKITIDQISDANSDAMVFELMGSASSPNQTAHLELNNNGFFDHSISDIPAQENCLLQKN